MLVHAVRVQSGAWVNVTLVATDGSEYTFFLSDSAAEALRATMHANPTKAALLDVMRAHGLVDDTTQPET